MASSAVPPPNQFLKTYSRRAKRARTGLADPPSSSPPPHSTWRDWAGLTSGPALLIADRVLSNDVADYIRFRAACTAWRRCTDDPRVHGSLDRRFHPRRWITLPKLLVSASRRRHARHSFMNASTGELIRVALPEIRGHHVFGLTCEGLVVLCHKRTHFVRLLNPLTRQLTELPHAVSLVEPSMTNPPLATRLKNVEIRSAGFADESTVAVSLGLYHLAVAKPGDERWTRLQCTWSYPRNLVMSSLSCAGWFYYATASAIGVVELDCTAASKAPPRMVVAAEVDGEIVQIRDKTGSPLELVDNDGELVLVLLDVVSSQPRVYRVDLEARKTVPVLLRGLGGRAVFVGVGGWRCSSLSVPAEVAPSVRADTVYVCDKRNGRRKIQAYHLLDGSTEEVCFDEQGDGSYLDYLSRFVCYSE